MHLGLVKWIQNHGNTVMKLLMSRSPKLLHSKVGQNSDGTNSPLQTSPKDTLQDHALPSPPQYGYSLMPQFMYPPAYGPAVFTPAPFMHYPMQTTMSMVPPRPGLLALPVGPPPLHQASQHRLPPAPVKQDVAASSSLPITVVASASQHGYPTPLPPNPMHFRHPFGRSHIICQYYLKGSCKFGASCRYLHPPLTAVPTSPPLPALASPTLMPSTPHQRIPPTPEVDALVTAAAQPPSQAAELEDFTQAQFHPRSSLTPSPCPQPLTPSAAPSSTQSPVGLKFQLICQLDTKSAESSASVETVEHFAAQGQDLFLSSNTQVHNYRIIFFDEPTNGSLHAEQASRFMSTFDLSWDHGNSRTTNDAVSCICCPYAEGVVWLGSNQGSIVRHDFNQKKTARVLNGQVSTLVKTHTGCVWLGLFQHQSRGQCTCLAC